MTLTGSEPLPPRRALGPTFRQDAIARSRSASVLTFIAPETWSSGSSTRSNNVGGSRRAMTSSQQTTSRSSSLRQSGYGCVLMSPRPKHKQNRRNRDRGDAEIISACWCRYMPTGSFWYGSTTTTSIGAKWRLLRERMVRSCASPLHVVRLTSHRSRRSFNRA